MNQTPRRPHLEISRRQLLRYSGVSAAAVAGSGFLAACGGDDGGGGTGGTGAQKTGGTLIHGATGGGSKDTLDPHAPVTNPDIDSDFVAGVQPESNTLFNFNFGLGAKIEMSEKLGMRLEGRWRVTDTAITTSSGIWCDPYGYCYSYASDWYNSGELIGGLSYSFR